MEEYLELKCGVEVSSDVERRIRNTGVKGLDFEVAKEVGCLIASPISFALHIHQLWLQDGYTTTQKQL